MQNPFRRKSISLPDAPTFRSSPPFDGPLDASNPDNRLPLTYSQLYETSPAVQAAVKLVSSSFAQVPFRVGIFRDGAVERFRDGAALENALAQPGVKYAISADLMVFGEAIFVQAGSGMDREFVRLSPDAVEVETAGSRITLYKIGSDGRYKPEEILHLRTYNPDDATRGLSPLKALRDLLEEERALNRRRVADLRGADRVIERPLEAPDWTVEALQRFELGFSANLRSREGGSPLLEEGMSLRDLKALEQVESRQYVWAVVCSIYGIPSASLAATASDRNADAARRSLLADCIQPIIDMAESALNAQAIAAFYGPDRVGRVFVVGDISDKTKGTFLERARALTLATGGKPWLSPEDAKASWEAAV